MVIALFVQMRVQKCNLLLIKIISFGFVCRKINEKNNPSIYCLNAGAMAAFPVNIRHDVVEIRISGMNLKSLKLENLKRYQQLKALTLTGYVAKSGSL